MAKRYIVDLRNLEPTKREAAYQQLDTLAFMVTRIFGTTGFEFADVIWDSSDDFTTSPALPHNCPYKEM